LFVSDNGAQEQWIPTTQYEGKYGPNYALGSNLPLRDFKTSNYEGALRVPAIFSWPKLNAKGSSSNYINVSDWMPTFLQWAQATAIPPSVEGEAIEKLLTTSTSARKKPIYTRGHLQESLIVPPFKLIRTRHLEGQADFELYDIETDPSETQNIALEHPKKVDELKVILKEEFFKDTPQVNVELKH
ncbi:MAG: sulfatase/phosphatase domain-containing protein, partial [Bacteroidota bacterium]|nr:sulfatase/phosphatase domain-containing protein [Bacteroidota bacterium]